MANRHIKRCSLSLTTREMQIKTTMRYHFLPVRMAIINKSTNNKCWQGYEEMRTLLHYWWKCSLMHLDLPFDLAIPIGDISEGTQNTNSKKHKHPYVHYIIIYNDQDMETALVSIGIWVDETTMGHLHNGMLLSHKKENFTLCDSMDGPREHYCKWNKPVRERQIPCDVIHMWNLMIKLN